MAVNRGRRTILPAPFPLNHKARADPRLLGNAATAGTSSVPRDFAMDEIAEAVLLMTDTRSANAHQSADGHAVVRTPDMAAIAISWRTSCNGRTAWICWGATFDVACVFLLEYRVAAPRSLRRSDSEYSAFPDAV